MMQAQKPVMLLQQTKYQSNNDYKKVFEDLINTVETYGGTFNEPGLLLSQLVKNGVVEGADEDILGEANPAQITAANSTVSEITQVAIFLGSTNYHKYKQLKDDLEKDLSKDTENYPTTAEIE